MSAGLTEVFARTRSEGRDALIGYLPAGFPTPEESVALIIAMVPLWIALFDRILFGKRLPELQRRSVIASPDGLHSIFIWSCICRNRECHDGNGQKPASESCFHRSP